MFGLGATEVAVILAVALICLGPQRLPEIARKLARLMGELRRVSDDLRANFDEASREIDTSLVLSEGEPGDSHLHEGELPPGVARVAAALRSGTPLPEQFGQPLGKSPIRSEELPQQEKAPVAAATEAEATATAADPTAPSSGGSHE